jgi:hypothetical protein
MVGGGNMHITTEQYYKAMAKAVLKGYFAGIKDVKKVCKKRVKFCCK